MSRDLLKKHSDRLYAEQVKAREALYEDQTCKSCGRPICGVPDGLSDRSNTGVKS